jgi:hypothetical protein
MGSMISRLPSRWTLESHGPLIGRAAHRLGWASAAVSDEEVAEVLAFVKGAERVGQAEPSGGDAYSDSMSWWKMCWGADPTECAVQYVVSASRRSRARRGGLTTFAQWHGRCIVHRHASRTNPSSRPRYRVPSPFRSSAAPQAGAGGTTRLLGCACGARCCLEDSRRAATWGSAVSCSFEEAGGSRPRLAMARRRAGRRVW